MSGDQITTGTAVVDTAKEARLLAVRQSLVAGHAPKAIVPQDFDGAWRIAQAVVAARMAPKSLETVEKCAVAILHGLEVGLTPMNSLQSIAVINGRPSLWGDGALGLIQASGLLEDQDEHFEGDENSTNFKAVCILKRKGKSRTYHGEFTFADAQKAGLLTKEGPWQTYRKRMYKMRARAFAMRDGFSDVLKGLSVAEEQEDVERGKQPDMEPEADALADVPAPPTETTTAKTETAATVIEGTAERVEGKAESDFPGDKPIVAAAAPAEEGIPWSLDRKLSENDRDFLTVLKEAFEQCHDVDQIGAEAESMMLPAKDNVSPYVWQKASDLMDQHIERVNKNG